MNPLSPIALFASGVALSFGPCIVPRLVAVLGLAGARHERRAFRSIVAYAVGLVATYAALGAVCALTLATPAISSAGYGVIAAVLLAMGLAELTGVSAWRATSCGESPCASGGAPALLGAFSTLLISPCCASAVFAVAAYTGSVAHAAVLLAFFGAEHALPVVFVGAFGSLAVRRLRNERLHHALSAGSGTLLLGLSGYYGLIA